MSRRVLARGRLITLPLDPTLRAAEIGHWEAEGYRVLEPRPGSRFVAVVEPLVGPHDIVAPAGPGPLELPDGLRSVGRMGLLRLEERLGPEPPLGPYDWAADDG